MNNDIPDPADSFNQFMESLRIRGQEYARLKEENEKLSNENKHLREQIVTKEDYEKLQEQIKSLKETVDVLSNENRILKKTVSENDEEIKLANVAFKNFTYLCTSWGAKKRRFSVELDNNDTTTTATTTTPAPFQALVSSVPSSFPPVVEKRGTPATVTRTSTNRKKFKLHTNCHRCKKSQTRRPHVRCCHYEDTDEAGKPICPKIFCHICIGILKEKVPESSEVWECPYCRGVCDCARCRRAAHEQQNELK